MTEDIIKQLNRKETRDDQHQSLLTYAKRLVNMSRQSMSKYYPDWDIQDRVFRGEICSDIEDRKAEQRGKPGKMIVPHTYAQCMSWTSFLFLLFKQNQRFFQLNPTGDEDGGRKREDMEVVLERDLRHNEFNTKLFQSLLDIPRFGLGIMETTWTKEITRAFIIPEPRQVEGPNGAMATLDVPGAWESFTKFEGNAVRAVSPYRFFPDTRHPVVDFQKGDFCAAEEEYSMAALRKMAKNDEVAGLDHIEPLRNDYAKERGAATRWSLADDLKKIQRFDPQNDSSVVLVTKVQMWITPNKFKFGPKDKPLGEEDFPILYVLWYANDNRIIKVEPARWWHNQFSWSIGQFTPDMHRTLSLGLADLISQLQNVVSWYVNSHITSVRRVIANRLVVDPKVIDTKSLDGEGDIYLKKGMSVPLDRAVSQLRVQDVTGSHMSDADIIGKLIEVVTGVNNNAMGQYNSGRRSAQESRVVTAGAASRLKLHAHLIWETLYGRMGGQMLTNSRQSLSAESFLRAVGMSYQSSIAPEEDMMMRYLDFKGNPADVICGDDYFMFDSTLASEKGFIAQSLQELLSAIMSNPMAAMQWDISAKALIEEIQRLRGAGNISQFSLSQRIASGKEAPPMPPPVDPNAAPAPVV